MCYLYCLLIFLFYHAVSQVHANEQLHSLRLRVSHSSPLSPLTVGAVPASLASVSDTLVQTSNTNANPNTITSLNSDVPINSVASASASASSSSGSGSGVSAVELGAGMGVGYSTGMTTCLSVCIHSRRDCAQQQARTLYWKHCKNDYYGCKKDCHKNYPDNPKPDGYFGL